jgi:hypothetical protein
MKTGKKGLSTIVTTLIIILLVLAAIGIIWGPIKNLLTNSSNSLDQTKCFSLNVQATKVTNATSPGGSATSYLVTLKREDSGNGVDSAGAKLIFYSAKNSSATIDFESDSGASMFTPLQVQTKTVSVGFANATSVEVTPYYIDPNTGQKQVCTTSQSFDFTIA